MAAFGIVTFLSNAIRPVSFCAFWILAKLSLSQIEMHIGRIAMSAILAQRKCRPRTAIMDLDQINTSHRLEQLTENVPCAPGTGRGHADLSRVGLGIGNELENAF